MLGFFRVLAISSLCGLIVLTTIVLTTIDETLSNERRKGVYPIPASAELEKFQ